MTTSIHGRWPSALLAVLWVALWPLPLAAAGDMVADCFGDGSPRRVEGCTELLETPGLNDIDRSLAHAMRALGRSLRGEYREALPDYDMAIQLDPHSAIALNNRAWTFFRLGNPGKGLPDIERSLTLSPGSPHALDTRAHIRQALGQPRLALTDYVQAMQLGGERIIKLYQCGLKSAGLYTGEINGLFTTELRRALETCVFRADCDPLPPDEDCQFTTS